MSNVFDRFAAGDAHIHDSARTSHAQAETEPQTPLNDYALTDVATLRTPNAVRGAVQELLKHGFVEEPRRRELFTAILTLTKEIDAVLEPLDLQLKTDSHRGVAYLVVRTEPDEHSSENEAWSHPLVRKQRLTLEQSFMIAILRLMFMHYEQEAGVGRGDAKVAVEDLLQQYVSYFGDTGSDGKNESKLLSLLDQLKGYGIVSEVDSKQEIVIRPLIAHLANPESLDLLLKSLKDQALKDKTSDSFGEASQAYDADEEISG